MRWRLFLSIFSMEARRQMSYRIDFFVAVVLNFVAAITIPFFFWGAIFSSNEGNALGGYSYQGMLCYVCLAVLVGRVVRGGDHMADISGDIYEGGLNRYLLYPTHYLGFKYVQFLGSLLPHVLQVFIFVPLLLFIVDLPPGMEISPWNLLLAIPTIMVGNLLYYLMGFPLQTVAFWADNVWSLSVMLRFASRLLGGALIPLSLFSDSVANVLQYLPFAMLYHLPVNTILGKLTLLEWATNLGMALAWIVVLRWIGSMVWRRGELSYTGVGI